MKKIVQKKLKDYSSLNKGISNKISNSKLQILGKSVLTALPVVSMVTLPTTQANGQIVHNSVAQSFGGSQTANINLGTLGNIAVKIKYTSGSSLYFIDNATINNKFVRTGYAQGYVRGLAFGFEIKTTNVFDPNSDKERLCESFGGDFCSGSTSYVGFEKGGKLGWMRVSVGSGSTSLVVHEYAYENTVGQSITTGETVLPVELITFSANLQNDYIRLMWATAYEEDNAGFEIQRSFDGKSFETIAFVDGNGTTLEKQEYFYDDEILGTGQQYYYRLKQIDYDGQFEYSEIITATLEAETSQVSNFYPNPTNGVVKLDYTAEVSKELTVTVYNVTGQALKTTTRTITAGINNLGFDFSDLPKGNYFVKLQAGEAIEYQKLVIE